MVALRILLIVIAVVALDIAVLFMGAGDPDEGWWPVSRALEAQNLHPSAENQRALDAAMRDYSTSRRIRLSIIALPIVLVTGAGFFLVFREFRGRRTRLTSGGPPAALSTI